MKDQWLRLILLVCAIELFFYQTPVNAQNTKNLFNIYLKPQYSFGGEKVGVYFGSDEVKKTVEDKYKYTENFDTAGIEGAISFLNYVLLSFYYTDNDKLNFNDKSENEFNKYWYQINYRVWGDPFWGMYVYYFKFHKELDIINEIDYSAAKTKYLIGIGANTEGFGMANMNFSDLNRSGLYAIMHLGAGSFENNIVMAPTNPYSHRKNNWTFKAEDRLGQIFNMDLGGIYSSKWGYLGAKLEVGGWFSGRVEIDGKQASDQIVTGTILMKMVAGFKFNESILIGFEGIYNSENYQNYQENETYSTDGSHFDSYGALLFVNIQFSI
ncbi:MAG: hypothetical protein HQK76_14520 [Desulfobacterales bacterium]|nr:hypothetical protein [Desulfobacterales bacterium]